MVDQTHLYVFHLLILQFTRALRSTFFQNSLSFILFRQLLKNLIHLVSLFILLESFEAILAYVFGLILFHFLQQQVHQALL
jgi:hypothetical protein